MANTMPHRRKVHAKQPSGVQQLLFTKREACTAFGVSPRTFERLCACGVITPIRLATGSLKYKRSDIEAYIESCEYQRGQQPEPGVAPPQ